MTLKEKAKAKAMEYQVDDVCIVWNGGCPNVRESAMRMYEWTKEQVLEKSIYLMQHWILEHDYVDIMELEDYVKQKMEEEL